MLANLPASQHDEWALRLWTAKEAVSKALGQGFHQGLHSLHITGFDTQSGSVDLTLGDGLRALFPALAGRKLTAITGRDNNLAVATAVIAG